MRIIYSECHRRHDPGGELNRGELVPAYETPRRAEEIHAAMTRFEIGPIESPASFSRQAITRVHCAGYVDFLEHVFEQWTALGRTGEATAQTWAVRGMRNDRVPESLDGRIAHYSFDATTPITAGTWEAAKGSADAALTAAERVATAGDAAVFALCRPPGHHAATDYFGGYCFLNNAAIAAQHLRDQGATRVGIIDIDYHHGNGTQLIFYARRDVPFVSIHATPATDFPYFLGYADETGAGEGEGFNRNLPLPRGTDWNTWNAALESACEWIGRCGIEAVVVSLGVDTFAGDPLASFRLSSEDYLLVGRRLARLRMPTVLVMEGGYALDHIGLNVANVLLGYEGG
jgi:acetoin utilization deacetylase AcuC-like enzyme